MSAAAELSTKLPENFMQYSLHESSGPRRMRARVAGAFVALIASLFAFAPAVFSKNVVIGMLPKFTSDPYFVAANKGAQQAGKELGITVEFNGPVDANVAAQADIIDRWVRRRVAAIAVS